MSKYKHHRSQKGMTLLEVLVALAIFATAALSVMKSVSQHLNTLSYLEQKTFAAMVADNTLAELMLTQRHPTAEQRGESELAGQTWYWLVRNTDTGDGYLQALDVTVFGDEARQNSLVTVRTYVAK